MMGKKWFILFSFIFISFVSSAVVLEEINSNLQGGETFVGRLELDLKEDIRKEELKIFEGEREVSFEKGVFRSGNVTFFYVIFPKGNFSIRVGSFLYYENGTLKEGSINHLISIGEGSDKILTISPGILYGSNLSLIVKNSGLKDLEVEIQGNKSSLGADSFRRVFINPESSFFYLDVKSYKTFKIPVFYFNDSLNDSGESNDINDSESDETNESVKSFFELEKNYLQANLTTNKSFVFEVSIENLINESFNVSVRSVLGRINFSEEIELEAFEKKIYSFEFFSEYEGIYSGNLTFSFNGSSEDLELFFYVLKNESSFDDFLNRDIDDSLTCEDVGGEICSEACVGGSINFRFGMCCVGGKCRDYDYEEGSKKNYLVGILSLAVVGILGYVIYKKFKEVKATPKL
jgi:hypothetical protein